jgi:predicted Rossmann fold flavoprotein
VSTVRYDVCILGGGASGLFCAATAIKRGRRVILVDHAPKLGQKIAISGGGRCNCTNLQVSAENYLSHNPHFCRSALARFTPQDFLALLATRQIAIEERSHGQIFCVDSAQRIVAMLLDACRSVELRPGVNVRSLTRQDDFILQNSEGEIRAQRVVIATGGLPMPSIGASDMGLTIAQQFGHTIVKPRPGLVPFQLAPSDRHDLAGIAVEAEVTAGGKTFRENLLFTHKGLSGPSVLQASSYWHPGEPISIDVFPGRNVSGELAVTRGVKTQLGNHLSQFLPKRLVQARLPMSLAVKPVAQLSKIDLAAIQTAFKRWTLIPSSTADWNKAEVMLGGVDTSHISSQTMESKLIPGLYFIGEVLDVTGWLGGYNLQWAWSSGFAAGSAV